jgi:tRNA (guanine-N7-)-methyltransferase
MTNWVRDKGGNLFQTLVNWQTEEHPIQWQQHFVRTAGIEVEIGFGDGHFLIANAEAHPERDFIGIELKEDRVIRALDKIALAGVNNIRLLQADARVALARLFRPQSVQRVYSLFPDPWPKNRHIKLRVFSHSFLQMINNRMKLSGELLVITDHHPYFDWVLKQTRATGFVESWELIPPGYCTTYEQKMRGRGQNEFYKIQLIKQEHIEAPLWAEEGIRRDKVRDADPKSARPARDVLRNAFAKLK